MFEVNSDYFIERTTIENAGYEVQVRELRKINEDEAKCTLYIWARDGWEFDEVPEQFYQDPICWESTMFADQNPTEQIIVFETDRAYLMHDGACCCLIGTAGHP